MDSKPSTMQVAAAEVLGTFTLVFVGCLTAITSGGDIVAIGLAFGLTVTVMAYAVGRVSGGHFNPAVTIGQILAGRVPASVAPLYLIAQFIGAVGAGLVLWVIFGSYQGDAGEAVTRSANGWADGVDAWGPLLVEVVITMIFLWVILAVTDKRNASIAMLAPLAIGVTLAVINFAAIGFTGASANPARSLGVALFDGDAFKHLWLFFLGPIVGAVLGAVSYVSVFGKD